MISPYQKSWQYAKMMLWYSYILVYCSAVVHNLALQVHYQWSSSVLLCWAFHFLLCLCHLSRWWIHTEFIMVNWLHGYNKIMHIITDCTYFIVSIKIGWQLIIWYDYCQVHSTIQKRNIKFKWQLFSCSFTTWIW